MNEECEVSHLKFMVFLIFVLSSLYLMMKAISFNMGPIVVSKFSWQCVYVPLFYLIRYMYHKFTTESLKKAFILRTNDKFVAQSRCWLAHLERVDEILMVNLMHK